MENVSAYSNQCRIRESGYKESSVINLMHLNWGKTNVPMESVELSSLLAFSYKAELCDQYFNGLYKQLYLVLMFCVLYWRRGWRGQELVTVFKFVGFWVAVDITENSTLLIQFPVSKRGKLSKVSVNWLRAVFWFTDLVGFIGTWLLINGLPFSAAGLGRTDH